jgi:hypothetical protein
MKVAIFLTVFIVGTMASSCKQTKERSSIDEPEKPPITMPLIKKMGVDSAGAYTETNLTSNFLNEHSAKK